MKVLLLILFLLITACKTPPPIIVSTPIQPSPLCLIEPEEQTYESYKKTDLPIDKYKIIARNKERRKHYIRSLQAYTKQLREYYCTPEKADEEEEEEEGDSL
jgi:hypothetical protein